MFNDILPPITLFWRRDKISHLEELMRFNNLLNQNLITPSDQHD